MLSIIKGLFAGLIISVPTGPAGLLCVKRTLEKGLYSGIATGIGVILSDVIYSAVVVMGLSNVEYFFVNHKSIIELIGAIILIVLGVFTYYSKNVSKKNLEVDDKKTLLGQMFTAFIITMANPFQIITFTTMYGVLHTVDSKHIYPALFILGLVIGALFWWMGISILVHRLRSKFKLKNIVILKKAIAIFITLSGIFILFKLIFNT